ncbi:MAG: flotillin-like protein FloA [Lentisphaerales bacterium]|nr:flotillin-like protein FloA [Lentisphaerales bacterium]
MYTLAVSASQVGIVIAILVVIAIVIFSLNFLSLFIQTWSSGAYVSPMNLIFMRLRNINPRLIVHAYIQVKKANLPNITTDTLEAHYLAGGDVINVINSLIAAKNASIQLDFNKAAAIDLAGRDVCEAVRTSVNPKVIDCPNPAAGGRHTIDAVAKDGIQLRAKARVTVKADIDKLIGGAVEETIIARVGEGIVTTIGSADSHKEVLENPDMISKRVLSKGLDSGTAFQILSIDIADIDVGENIGARLQADQAEADKRVAQAKAEMRRAAAVALEQEMQAKVQEMQAKVIEAQAQVPLAMSAAFRDGNLGIMDYYRMENIKSDTTMRQSISGTDEEGSTVQ